MNYENDRLSKIKENELKALFFIKYLKPDYAIKILEENIAINTESSLTYDILIKIYENKKDYHSLINTLNQAIKYTTKKDFYRKIKKQLIIAKFISQFNKISS